MPLLYDPAFALFCEEMDGNLDTHQGRVRGAAKALAKLEDPNDPSLQDYVLASFNLTRFDLCPYDCNIIFKESGVVL